MEDNELWKMDAACRGVSPAIFIPEPSDDRHVTEVNHAAALTYCVNCPVTRECLEWAISTGEEVWGVYGNTTPRQRRTIRERRKLRAVALVGA